VEYFVKRGEDRFGPYSLTDLQKYVQSGNVANEDLAQSEGMPDWIPVSLILGNIPMPVMGAGVAAPGSAVEAQLVPLPPNLHWSLVLILGVVTFQLFNMVWAVVLANWARKLSGDNKPIVLVAMYPAGIVAVMLMTSIYPSAAPFGAILRLAIGIIYIVGMFSIKAAMEEYYNYKENIGLQLSGTMTFFFSTVYLQYHVNSISRWKKTGVLK
jgi:hypothetical protein